MGFPPPSGGGGSVASVFTRTGAVVAAAGDYMGVVPAALTGATAATRYVGGTASGAPASGTFAVGDFIVDQTGDIWVCTAAGTPGTWTNATGTMPLSVVASASTITATPGYLHAITGTTTINTINGGVAGATIILYGSGQAAYTPVILSNSGNILLKPSVAGSATTAFGIYAGETITLLYNSGTSKWVEISRNVNNVLYYGQITSNVSVTATTEATANSVIAASAITFDGATPILMEFFAPYATPGGAASLYSIWLDGATSLGYAAANISGSTAYMPGWNARKRFTPTNAAHTYSVAAFVGSGTGTISAGAGGTGAANPAWIKITRDI